MACSETSHCVGLVKNLVFALRYLIPQVVKVELPYATNWRDFIYFF